MARSETIGSVDARRRRWAQDAAAPLALALALASVAGCVGAPERDNPLDPKAAGGASLEVELAFTATFEAGLEGAPGAVVLRWQDAPDTLGVSAYRVLRQDRAADTAGPWAWLGELAPGGGALELRDDTPLAGVPDVGYGLVLVTDAGTTDRVAEATFAPSGDAADVDGDGFTDTDCAALALDVFPGAAEVCNGLDDNCDGRIDELVSCAVCSADAPCPAGYACEDGICVEAPCDPPDCGGGASFCVAGGCVGIACVVTGDCPAGAVCNANGFAGQCVWPGAGSDGDACTDDLDCASSHCSASSVCGARMDPCPVSPLACPGGLVCGSPISVCTTACVPGSCADGERCVEGFCLPACTAPLDCQGATHCVYPSAQPSVGGGCGPSSVCDSCAEGARCVAGPNGALACCTDADGDGRYGLECPWGTDCDDGNPALWNQCDSCSSSADCQGAQCVLLPGGDGLCGGPAGCHCPDGSACLVADAGELEAGGAPQCVGGDSCLDDSDCALAFAGLWRCEAVDGLDGAKRCVCDDPSQCPACVLDAECPSGQVCVEGGCQ